MKEYLPKVIFVLAFYMIAAQVNAQSVYQTVGIIGTATSQGWNASTPMELTNTSDPHQWNLTIQLNQGELKFRADDSWTVNWGGFSFPSGTAQRDGANLQIPSAGLYDITFNDVTGNYNFVSVNATQYETVGIVGSATPNGWDASTAMVRDASNPHQWSLDITLSTGELKFRADNNWSVNWGGTSFPEGTATQNGANIPVAAGEYTITFNDITGEYLFRDLNPQTYETVGIIGSATANGWDNSTPMKLSATNDANSWIITTYLLAGELKFRANNTWDVNWGGSDFPSGTATQNGSNIVIPETSYYTIRFNDVTRAYSLTKLNPASFSTVGIIGTATASGWDASTPMDQQADGHTWTLTNIQLSAGEAKFRANNGWTTNWGATDFPTGTGTQDGPNIPVAAGFYNVTFNDVTAEYSFVLTGENTDGIVVLSPAVPTADESVTITYDASQGVSGLRGSEKVYMHSGVVLSGFDGTAWSNVVGNWGQDNGVGEMTPVAGEENKWQITIPSVREYYNVEEGTPVFRLAMVFRNADGTQTGKSETDGDIFVNIDAGDFVRFTAPLANEIFGLSGETLTISAEASSVAHDITLEINDGDGFDVVAQQSNTGTISHSYSITKTVDLQLRVTALLEGNTVTATKTIRVNLRQPNTIAALPEGLHNGINYDDNDPTKATLVLLAPGKDFVYAVGDFNNWTISDAYQMNQTPDGEYFWIELDNLTPAQEYVYQYWVDGTIKIGDPYADKVADPFQDGNIPSDVYPDPVNYTNTANGIATILQTAQQPFVWTHPTVNGGQPAKEDLVIYELLLRDFLGSHSYSDLADTLSYLKRLGVNAIELLPIMEFEGNESWGYNPTYLFAPDKYYGTRNDLKAFINKAHEEGFVVLLDMVLNHQFGQSPMVRMYFDEASGRPSAESPWFNQEATHPFNVGYDFNHESAYTKRYIDDVNRYWLEEYHFDGYRFDLSKGFTQVNNPNDVGAWSAYDQSRIDILKRMTDVIWDTDPDAYVIFEHLAVNEEEKVLADYGIMLWGNMNHAYNSAVNGHASTDLNWGLSSSRSWSQKNLVPYMESHDEERLLVRAKDEGLSNGDYDIKELETALQRVKLASAFFYTLPGPKMLWQFGELGYDISINYNGRTGNKPIPWGTEDNLNYHQDEERVKLYKATAAIINLVDDYNEVFEGGNFSWTPSGQFRRINVTHSEMNVAIAGNFGLTSGSMEPGFQHTGIWYDYFSGRPFTVTSTSQNVSLEAGEFHIYVDKPVSFPEKGLVKTSVQINAPLAMNATLSGNNVMLTWEDTSDGETGFDIQRKDENESEYATIATAAGDAVSFVDTATLDGVTYTYRVKTVSDVKPHSAWSTEATIDLVLNSPGILSAEIISKREVMLLWQDNSLHENNYIIERSVSHGKHTSSFNAIAVLNAGTTTFADNDIQPGKNYTYRVYAADSDEVSAYSSTVTTRTAGKSGSVISIYPNAASDFVTVSYDGSADESVKVTMTNMQGVVLQRLTLTADNQIAVSVRQWPEGVYIVESKSSKGVIREQLIVKR